MADLIRAPKVSVITKDGECKLNITIDLNLNINGLTVSSAQQVQEEEKVEWTVPEFKTTDKVKFGKKG